MTVYEGVKLLQSVGWWDILRTGTVVNPSVDSQLLIYETYLSYVEQGGALMDCEVWTADDYTVSVYWVRKLKQKFSAPLPEGALLRVEMLVDA